MLFKNKEKNKKIEANQFWDWFENNNQKYLFLNQIKSNEVKNDLLDGFKMKLHQYCENLYFEIGGHPDDEKVELIISAEGNIDYFENVNALVNKAPKLRDWKIIAFKPPMGKGFKTNYQGKVFDPAKIIFIPLNNEEDPNGIGFNVCYPDYTDDEREVFLNGTYITLDCLIGEKSTSLDIEYIDVIKTPENIADYNFKHLEDITEYINEKKNES